MEKYWKYIFGIIVLGFLIYILTANKPAYNNFTFPQTITVHNYTSNPKTDTVAMVILNKIMLYDTMTVNIYKLNDIFDNQDFVINAHVIKNVFVPHTYNIFIRSYLNLYTIEYSLSHEFIHIDQMERNRLIIYQNTYSWNDTIYNMKDVKYENRPYEIEAYNKQTLIYDKLINIYKK
jgi:hypothetical protein